MSAANITVPVDLTNPGQFFACCGLLELADRIWPGTEAWFEPAGTFKITGGGSLISLMQSFQNTEIHSSLSASELKRLATLLSARKDGLSPDALAEKARLQQMWRRESVIVGPPFDLRIDWWHDERGERRDPKTWAAKQLVMEIVGSVRTAMHGLNIEAEPDLWQWKHGVDRRFNFDAALGAMGGARDVGFSFDALADNKRTRIDVPCRPCVELFAFIGLQRCRPVGLGRHSLFKYAFWHVPLGVNVASAASIGELPVPATTRQFQLFDRSDYFKCFSPAIPYQGDRDG